MSVFMTVRRKIEFNKRPIKKLVMVIIQVRPRAPYIKDCRDAVLFYRRSKINITNLTSNNFGPDLLVASGSVSCRS